MRGKEFFDGLLQTFERIVPSKKSYEFFIEIQNSLIDFEIIDSFYQLKKDDKGSGLALEIMLFDSHLIYDLVFSVNSVDFITLPLENINSVIINAVQEVKVLADNKTSASDILELTINSNDSNSISISYRTDTKRFSEFNRIRANLSKLL